MPIFFLIVGALLIIVSINDKLAELGGLVRDDFTTSSDAPSFSAWLLAIFVAGSLGYIKELRPVANAFLVLIVIGMLLSNKGFFAKFSQSISR